MYDLMKRRSNQAPKSNKINVPEARAAMDKFKMEAAAEVGVKAKEGYNGHLTSREAGSVSSRMVKKMRPVRTLKVIRHNRTATGNIQAVQYIASIMG